MIIVFVNEQMFLEKIRTMEEQLVSRREIKKSLYS